MTKASQKGAGRVPEKFFCPISKNFMKDPAISRSTKRTYDRNSVVSLREGAIKTNVDNDILPPRNETLLPDHDIRGAIGEWHLSHTLMPPFSFISTPRDLEAAVVSLLNRQQHQLEDPILLQYLHELNVAMQRRSTIVNSKQCFLLVSRLIAECPLTPNSDFSEWVHLSVSILTNAHNFNDELDLGEYQDKFLSILDKFCANLAYIDFQVGLVNLIHSLMAAKEQIIHKSGIVRALSSYVIKPGNDQFGSKEYFDKLFYVILGLWNTSSALEHPRLSQAVATLVWPMHKNMGWRQYKQLLQTVSTRLKSQLEVQTPPLPLPLPVEALSRAGLVSRIFHVLEYVTFPASLNVAEWLGSGHLTSPASQELLVMRCFEILECLSIERVGRLEIVRVICRSGYSLLLCFYVALSRNIVPRLKESHVVPALTMMFNVLKNTRFIPLLETVHGPTYNRFAQLVNDEHPKVNEIANRIFSLCAQIKFEERDPPTEEY